MIILLGPDHTGKTTLANKLEKEAGFILCHHSYSSKYEDYLKELEYPTSQYTIHDRFIFCEMPYAAVLNREFQYTDKQWHNIVLTTLSYSPTIVLCVHKPLKEEYHDDYLSYELWEKILKGYKDYLTLDSIPYVTYDYHDDIEYTDDFTSSLLYDDKQSLSSTKWCSQMRRNGTCFIGSCHPDLLIVGERMGPNNTHQIPFETGPTGQQMTEFINHMRLPLGKIAITNMVKAPRRDERPVNDADIYLFKLELMHLKPKAVLLMGAISKAGIPALKEYGIKYEHVAHFGFYNHSGVRDLKPIYERYNHIVKQMLGVDSKLETLI